LPDNYCVLEGINGKVKFEMIFLSSREILKDFIKVIKEHKDKIEVKFSKFLPYHITYFFDQRYTPRSNCVESIDVSFLFSIGVHKNLFRNYEIIWDKIWLCGYDYLNGLKCRYFVNHQRYDIIECFFANSKRTKGNVALTISPIHYISRKLDLNFADSECFVKTLEEIARKEKENIKNLLKELLLQC